MRCETCGVNISLPTHQKIEVDTLIKEYDCRNGHKNIYKRYGHTVEINGEKYQVEEMFNLSDASRLFNDKIKNTLKLNEIRAKKNRL